MNLFKPSINKTGIIAVLRRRDASAALEFAIVVPLLVVLLMGVVEITLLVRANMKLSYATWMLANIVSQQTSVTSDELSNFCGGAASAMLPFPPGQFTAGIASQTNGSPTMPNSALGVWNNAVSCPGGSAKVADSVIAGAAATVPSDGSSIIIVSASYQYQPFLKFFIRSKVTLSQNVIVRGRSDTPITMQ